jgi:hypothetical protein
MNTKRRLVIAAGVLAFAVSVVSPAWGQSWPEGAFQEWLRWLIHTERGETYIISQRDYNDQLYKAPTASPFASCTGEACFVCPGLVVGAACRRIPKVELQAAELRAAAEATAQVEARARATCSFLNRTPVFYTRQTKSVWRLKVYEKGTTETRQMGPWSRPQWAAPRRAENGEERHDGSENRTKGDHAPECVPRAPRCLTDSSCASRTERQPSGALPVPLTMH